MSDAQDDKSIRGDAVGKKPASRELQRAEALRENLIRRKAQAREREDDETPKSGSDA